MTGPSKFDRRFQCLWKVLQSSDDSPALPTPRAEIRGPEALWASIEGVWWLVPWKSRRRKQRGGPISIINSIMVTNHNRLESVQCSIATINICIGQDQHFICIERYHQNGTSGYSSCMSYRNNLTSARLASALQHHAAPGLILNHLMSSVLQP